MHCSIVLIVLLHKILCVTICVLIDCLLCGQAAVEEGIVVGGGCTLLRLASKVDAIIETLENDEQKVGKK